MRHLPTEPLAVSALPPFTSRDEYEAARANLLAKEKAHTRQGDAIAAERRRLPMTEIPASVTVVGANGEVPFLDAFEGRRMLVGYFHMWHDGHPWEGQCIGCTYFASQVQGPLAHLHARDVTLAYLCEGTYEEAGRTRTSWATRHRGIRRAARAPVCSLTGASAGSAATCVTMTTACTRPTGPPTAATRRASGLTACWTAPCSDARSGGKTPPTAGPRSRTDSISGVPTAAR